MSAAIVVVLAVAALVVWAKSPVRHTDSAQSARPAADVAPATTVPERLAVAWRARSTATSGPSLARSMVVTAADGEVVGHDPATGDELWHYRRNLSLCAALAAWPTGTNSVLAVYRNSRGCSEVTALDGSSGQRVGARSSDADDHVALSADAGYVVSQGPTRLETWGSNLVRGIEYGRVDAPVKPDVQPGRTGCRLYSSALGGDRVAVIERCDRDTGYRLTVLGAVLDDDEKVQQYGSSLITEGTAGPPPVLVAMGSSGIAVYDGGADPPSPASDAPSGSRTPSIRRFSTDGVPSATNLVAGDPSAPAGPPVVTADGLTSYFTGKSTVILESRTLRPIYQVPGTIGSGDTMGGQLLLPIPDGISVRDAATGREIRTIAVPRDGRGDAPVTLRTLGGTVVEQWGSTVQALGAS